MTAQPATSPSAVPSDSPVTAADRELPPLAREYPAWLITSLAARLSRGASSYYTREWKIGSTEYRLLMALGREKSCSGISAATAADIDKAAASRSLKTLEAGGLVESVRRGREMQIQLTTAGRHLRSRLKTATDRRDRRLTHGMSAAEVARLRADLHRLLDNLP